MDTTLSGVGGGGNAPGGEAACGFAPARDRVGAAVAGLLAAVLAALSCRIVAVMFAVISAMVSVSIVAAIATLLPAPVARAAPHTASYNLLQRTPGAAHAAALAEKATGPPATARSPPSYPFVAATGRTAGPHGERPP